MYTLCSYSIIPIEVDTIYYDKKWKGLSNPYFASYYKVIEKNLKADARKLYRNYYITGELQGEGEYLLIDREDDKKSILNGEWVSYYKSGNLEQKGFWDKGTQQGEYIRFFEDGNLAVRANMVDGQYDGLYTEFLENGLCYQIEYCEGKPCHDYYVISNDEGLYSKVRILDETPYYTSPSLNSRNVKYINGKEWSYYINDGILIAVTSIKIKDYGKYYRVFIDLTNNSFYPIEFDPSDIMATMTNKNGEKIEMKVLTAGEYDKNIKRSQKWSEVLVGLVNGLSTANAGYSTSTTTSTYTGTTGSGVLHTTSTTYDASIAAQARLTASQNLLAFSESNLQIRRNRNEDYLKKTTIASGESINGYINIEYQKCENLMLVFNICGAKYQFPLTMAKEQTDKVDEFLNLDLETVSEKQIVDNKTPRSFIIDQGVKIGYRGFVDVGYTCGIGDFGEDRIELMTSHGYQFCPYFYGGVGLGGHYYQGIGFFVIPVFANIRTDFLNRKNTPYLDLKAGYSMGHMRGLYLSPVLGARFAISNSAAVNIGVGYTLQRANFLFKDWSLDWGWEFIKQQNCGGFTIKVGVDF